ncbi:MAG TPA: alpha/beta hydrolase-fold protein [Roseiflexaceae bacterium]|nr:alpha/beta hydrolase-fold protein [Roseiflexaceae bacterium]
MTDWQGYSSYVLRTRHTVVGDLLVLPGVVSPQLGNARDLFVYLPPSYATGGERRYPVLYMHDGQNLFDAALSYAGEWQVDETMEMLATEGREAIVVGVPNMGYDRLLEYGPFAERRHGESRADAYLAFLAETVKPLIDRTFRTLPDRASTGVAGSSMGGLISLYAFFKRPELFGFAGVLSPSLWFGRRATLGFVARAPFLPGRLYLDTGTREGPPRSHNPLMARRISARVLADARRLRRVLLRKGYRPGQDLCYVEDAGGRHNEADWARRLPDALRFLLPGPPAPPRPPFWYDRYLMRMHYARTSTAVYRRSADRAPEQQADPGRDG